MQKPQQVTPEQQEAAFKKFLSPESDKRSRYNWSLTAVAIMVNNWDVDKLWDVVEGGYSKFNSIASATFSKHRFKEEDYRRMWDIIERTARMNSAQRTRFTSQLIIEASR